MDWATITDAIRDWGWAIIGVAWLSYKLKSIDDNHLEMNIGATSSIENGILSPEKISIRYLIDIERLLSKIFIVILSMLIIGGFVLARYNMTH